LIRLGARGYNPTIGRFDRTDPVIEEQEQFSLYQYGWNNPVLRSDPDGECPVCFVIFAGLFLASQPALAPSGGKNAKQEMAAYKQTYNDMGSDVVSSVMPVGKSATVSQALYATAKKEVKVEIKEQGQKVVEKTMESSRVARREAMRGEGIPTSQQPKSQSKNSSGREYSYGVPKKGGGTQTKSVQQQTMDRSHQGENHWEAGKVKTDRDGNTRMNNYDRPKLENDKTKVNY